MMSRVDKFILFVFFLSGLINFYPVVLAQENTIDAIANRPQIEYKSADLRDPFQTCIIKVREVIPQVQETNLAQLGTKFSEFKVQGIIWGTKMPQAIINNKVYIVGDKIEDAKILSIDKRGVNLSTAAGIISLAAPGQNKEVDLSTAVGIVSLPVPGGQDNVLNKDANDIRR